MDIRRIFRAAIAQRTKRNIRFDVARLRARLTHHLGLSQPASPRLHLGCGERRIAGWLNVDVAGSDFDVDLGAGQLPFHDEVFEVVVSQQVIEHLEMETQLLPLLRELFRVCKPGAEIWLSCPDMDSICRSYLKDGGIALLEDRKMRWPEFTLEGAPPSQMLNVLFHQAGEHVNLFDFQLLSWLVQRAGFRDCTRVDEAKFKQRFSDFPVRDDDEISLYVRAMRP
jgi:predicted SAM-dependent methyltransferase